MSKEEVVQLLEGLLNTVTETLNETTERQEVTVSGPIHQP